MRWKMRSAREMGIIDESLVPFFCCKCGGRLGWTRERNNERYAVLYCEDCAKQEPQEEGD